MNFHVAYDPRPDDPDPHAWIVVDSPFPSESEARLAAVSWGEDDPEWVSGYIVVMVRNDG